MGKERKNHSYYDAEKGIVFGSLSKGTDLIEGIIEQCKKHQIDTGMVSFIGSVERAGYVYPARDADGNPRYSELVKVDGPLEVLNGTGFICDNKMDGDLDIHLHALFIGEQGTVLGGHMIRGENPTYITIEFSIIVGEKVKAVRQFNEHLGFPTIDFYAEGE